MGASVTELEAVLTELAIFENLRVDEVARIARRFELVERAAGERCEDRPEARLVVVVRGVVDVEVTEPSGTLRARMAAGDRFGTFSLVTGYVKPFVVIARAPATLAIIDHTAFEAVLAEFPIIAVPFARELANELASRDDFMRQLLELHAAKLPADQLAAAIAERRTARQKRGARVVRTSTRGLFHRLVIARGAEPPFWMLVGFLTSLGGARLVVHLILKFKLEKQLFALVPGTDPNPMHIHHFNYGLFLIGATGLAALFPLGRRMLRRLAFIFGIGAGLVFDEFAIFWNLNPEYAQELSVIAAAMAAAVLLQLVYFRRFWGAVARRTWLSVRGTR